MQLLEPALRSGAGGAAIGGVPASGGSTVRASCASSIQPGTAMLRTACNDAENRMVSVTDVNGVSSTYAYDGSSLRIGKTSGGNTTTYVYDAFGYLAAEYSSQAATSACDTNTCYPILDHLGSTRMLTDANGSSTVTRYDYLPFGQELLASTNGRTTGMGYLASPDGSNPKFTGKNRDNESGFDWFEVRHMSGAQGRFQSVDPGNAGAQPEDPQTWNAYSYVGNNPLSYTDPSGQGFWSGFLTFLVGFFGGNIYPPVGSGFPNIGSVNTGPWNEQIPSGIGSGGSVNTGGVFGSGGGGPFVNNVLSPDVGTDYTFYATAIGYLMRDTLMAKIIGGLQSSKTVYHVHFIRDGNDYFDPATNSVSWDPRGSFKTRQGGCQSAALGLGHELSHAYGIYGFQWPTNILASISFGAGDYQNWEERRVITGAEASAAATLGEPRRYDHKYGFPTVDPSSTSRSCAGTYPY